MSHVVFKGHEYELCGKILPKFQAVNGWRVESLAQCLQVTVLNKESERGPHPSLVYSHRSETKHADFLLKGSCLWRHTKRQPGSDSNVYHRLLLAFTYR